MWPTPVLRSNPSLRRNVNFDQQSPCLKRSRKETSNSRNLKTRETKRSKKLKKKTKLL
jgi:hypothetical protein